MSPAPKDESRGHPFDAGGYEILSGPRVTGDGYYETSLLGWEGINIEITV